MGKKAPKSPDPYATAAAQSGSNRDTAITQMQLNAMNQYNPWGSVEYTQSGTNSFVDSQGKTVQTPNFTQTTKFTPETQAIFDSYMGSMGNLSSLAEKTSGQLGATLGQGVSMDGAPALRPGAQQSGTIGGGYNTNFSGDLGPDYRTSYAGADDFSADRQRVEDALWQRQAGDREASEASLRATLVNKGIREGSAAWDAEMSRMGKQNTDARLATILAGGQEQSRLVGLAQQAAQFGNEASLAQAGFGSAQQQQQNQAALQALNARNQANLTNAQFGNSARDQYLSEQLALRNQSINEMGSLFGMGGSSLQSPGTYSGGTPTAGVAGTDIGGMINQDYQNRLGAHNAQMGGMGGLFGSIFGAAGSAGGFGALFSDERLKTDVSRVGETAGGLPLYAYRYVWGGPVQIGVMAQEAMAVYPEAVSQHESGFLMVDYSRIH